MRNYRKKVSWKEILKRTHQNKHSNMDIPCANCGKTFKNKETFLSFPFFSKAQKELSSCNWWTVDGVIRKWLLFFFAVQGSIFVLQRCTLASTFLTVGMCFRICDKTREEYFYFVVQSSLLISSLQFNIFCLFCRERNILKNLFHFNNPIFLKVCMH